MSASELQQSWLQARRANEESVTAFFAIPQRADRTQAETDRKVRHCKHNVGVVNQPEAVGVVIPDGRLLQALQHVYDFFRGRGNPGVVTGAAMKV